MVFLSFYIGTHTHFTSGCRTGFLPLKNCSLFHVGGNSCHMNINVIWLISGNDNGDLKRGRRKDASVAPSWFQSWGKYILTQNKWSYPDSSIILNSLVTFPRLQSDSDCRVNFKYHEIIMFFRKMRSPGLEPAIPCMAEQCSTIPLASQLLQISKKIYNL